MATYHFQVCTAAVTATFDCPSCGKTNRKRTLRADCTVSPFNKNEDGSVRTHAEVSKQSQKMALQERDQFMRKPLCATCENRLSYTERRALFEQRRSAEEAV